MLTGVIGSGLKLYPRIKTATLGLNAESARSWTRRAKEEFELWCGQCDFLRRNNFFELQRIAFASYLVDGDSFCLFRRRLPTSSNPYSLRLQIIEAGRVSNPNGIGDGVEVQRGNNRIINGIEIDRAGSLVAVWIANRYWNEPSTSELRWQRVRWFGRDTGCRNVLMIANDTRPDMNRGVPLLAPLTYSPRINAWGVCQVDYCRERVPNVSKIIVQLADDGCVDLHYVEHNIKFERIRRITGYLVGTTDRWNDAKQAEERDRLKHVTRF